LKGFKFKGNDEDGGGEGLRNRSGERLNGGARLAVCLVLMIAVERKMKEEEGFGEDDELG
ncbi:hypothetical protein L195_g064512, partial [Trifolium pratense]